MNKNSFLILFICFTFQLNAQNEQLESLVRGFFPQPEQIKWLKHYSGDVDDINRVAVTLASDGYQCKGTMTYLRSNEVLKLEGNIVGKTLKLAEINKLKDTSGFLLGQVIDNKINAEWTNYDGSIGRLVNLTEIKNRVASFNDFDNQWIKKYRGIVKMQDEVEMILQRLNQDEIKGVAYFHNKSEKFIVNGTIKGSNQISLTFTNSNGEKIADLTAEPSANKELRASYIEPTGESHFASFELKAKMEVDNITYSDYSTNYEILYPKSNNPAFNLWIKEKLKDWVEKCNNQVKYVNGKQIKENPKTRSTRRAYVWFDMEHISEDIISGDFIFTNTWDDKTEGQVFNYDLKKGEEIELNDILKKGTSFNSFFNKYIKKQIKAHPMYKDRDFKDWISKEKFDNFTIQKSGLAFSTLFDELYGKVQFIIPYGQLQPFFKNNNPILR